MAQDGLVRRRGFRPAFWEEEGAPPWWESCKRPVCLTDRERKSLTGFERLDEVETAEDHAAP